MVQPCRKQRCEGYILLVEPLLAAGADPDIHLADGATALFMAAVRGHTEVIAALMKAGADPSIKGPRGKTATDVARMKYGEADDFYIREIYDSDAGESKNPTESERAVWVLLKGYIPLHYVAEHNEDPHFMTRLLDQGADVKTRNNDEETALHDAARSNENPQVLALLLDHGADVNARDKYNSTPLHDATYNENPDVLDLLIDHSADVNARDVNGNTPLYYADGDENPAIKALLLDRGGVE